MAAAPPELCRVSFVVGDAATDRRAVMRAWTIPILGAVALSLAAPPIADARARFGPAVLLGAIAAPLGMFAGGSRHSVRYYRRGTARPSNDQGDEGYARADRPGRGRLRSCRPARGTWRTQHCVGAGILARRLRRSRRLSALPQGEGRPLLGLRLRHDRGRDICWFARR